MATHSKRESVPRRWRIGHGLNSDTGEPYMVIDGPPTPEGSVYVIEDTEIVPTRGEGLAIARAVAREHGYAVGVHGSLRRDIDLIAVPWVDDASTPLALAQAIAAELPGFLDEREVAKPHGRIGYTIIPNGVHGDLTKDGPEAVQRWAWFIDLSIMPRRRRRAA